MEIRHLRYFVAVAETGSVSEAARSRLHTSQPSLSRQMSELEDELKVRLFDRQTRGVALTAAGVVFLDHSRRILGSIDEAISAARSAPVLLRIGCLPGLESEILPKVSALAGAHVVDIEIQVTSASSGELLEKLRNGRLDMAFTRPDENAQDVAFVFAGEHSIVAIIPTSHVLAGRSNLAFSELNGQAFIAVSRESAPALCRSIDVWSQGRGERLAPSHIASNITSSLSLVQTTAGFTLAPAYMELLLPSSLVGCSLCDGPPSIPFAIAYMTESRFSNLDLVHAIAESWISSKLA